MNDNYLAELTKIKTAFEKEYEAAEMVEKMRDGDGIFTASDKYGVGIAQIPVAWAIAKGTLPIIGVTKVSHVEDAVKAANVILTDEETKGLEALADSLNLNVIRFWEKEMK